MKKIAFFSIFALAMTAFACDDSDKKGGENNGPQDEWTGGTVEQKADFFIKKAAEKTLACAEANAEHNIASDNMDILRENAKGILSDPMMLLDPYASCMSKMADYFECEASLDCDGLFKIWSEDEEDYGKCEAAENAMSNCYESHDLTQEALEQAFKKNEKEWAKKVITCAEADSSVEIDADNLEDLQVKANDSESYTYLKAAPYRYCLSEFYRYISCASNQECDILLDEYKVDDIEKANRGECKTYYVEYHECMDDSNYLPSEVELLCQNKISCTGSGDSRELTAEEIVQCAKEDKDLDNANCRSAKVTYFKCLDSDEASFCSSIAAGACETERVAEEAACNPEA